MTDLRSSACSTPARRRHVTLVALLLLFAAIVGACGGSEGGGASLSDASIRGESPERSDLDETPPDLLADKEVQAECDNALGTGDAAFEAAFCAYQAAALEATSGPDGVSGIDPKLLSAGDDAIVQFATDPAGATATLVAATEALG